MKETRGAVGRPHQQTEEVKSAPGAAFFSRLHFTHHISVGIFKAPHNDIRCIVATVTTTTKCKMLSGQCLIHSAAETNKNIIYTKNFKNKLKYNSQTTLAYLETITQTFDLFTTNNYETQSVHILHIFSLYLKNIAAVLLFSTQVYL